MSVIGECEIGEEIVINEDFTCINTNIDFSMGDIVAYNGYEKINDNYYGFFVKFIANGKEYSATQSFFFPRYVWDAIAKYHRSSP